MGGEIGQPPPAAGAERGMSVVPLNVLRWGDPAAGRTVVALHGITANGGAWTTPARLLADRGWHVIATEMRGHGESGRGDGDFSAEALLGDIAAAVPHRPDVLIGHSFGGYLAQLAVLGGRLRPGSLVLEDPVSFFADKEAPAAFLAREEGTPRDIAAIMARNPGWSRRDAAWKLLSLEQLDFANARAAFIGNAPWDLRPRARELARLQPTVWVVPEPSIFVPAEDRLRLKAEAGERAVVALAGVGHSVHRDAPVRFVEVVEAMGEGRWPA
jgi:pimeloyl-ACP methyl ester carboxylesterase